MRLAIAAALAAGAAALGLLLGATVTQAGGPTPTSTATLSATSTATTTATITPSPTHTAVRTPTPVNTPRPHPTEPGPFMYPTPIPDVNFWISVKGVPGCSTEHGDATCQISPGSTFEVDVYLGPLPTTVPSYAGFDIALQHSGVTPNHDASTAAWPDCVFPAASYDDVPHADQVKFACAVGVPPAGGSHYSGLIGTLSFVCAQSGAISLLPGAYNTDLVEFDNISISHAEDPSATDILTINCGPNGLPASGSSAASDDTHHPGIVALAMVAGGLALLAIGWRARRRPRADG